MSRKIARTSDLISTDDLTVTRLANTYGISPLIVRPLLLWAKDGREPGGFLRRVLQNDLTAVCYADPENLRDIAAIVRFVLNEIPGTCHGCKPVYETWIAEFAESAELG